LSTRILLSFVFCGLITVASAQDKPSFNRFTYNGGIGLGIGKDDVASYVGNSFNGVAGAGFNFNRLFGVDAEYMYYDLNFRPSVKQSQSLTDQSGNMQSISVDGIVTVPRHFGKLSAYGIFGVGFYRRTVSIPSRTIGPGTIYQPAWRWWDIQRDIFNTPLAQTMSSNTKDAGGFNFGGGLNYRLNRLHDSRVYLEYRYHRAYQSDGKTIVMPITVGLRW
jgi:opacity protein-like surface antigen